MSQTACLLNWLIKRAINSVVECYIDIVNVTGSIPVLPTNE